MNKRIYLIVLALVFCLAATLAGLISCDPNTPQPTTHTVTYVYGNGDDNLVRTVNDGDKAIEPKDPEREGYTFDYWYSTSTETAYNFDSAVTEDLTLTAHWTEKSVTPPPTPPTQNTYISWNSGNYAEILIDGQSGIQLNSVKQGEEVYFKLHISPYSVGVAVVAVNGQQLTADKDGWYVLTAEGSQMSVTVSGLENDSTPITGVGSYRDPYVLHTPANFKTFADSVNNSRNSKYNDAYIALDADLSFNGEELEPIGLVLNESHFSGTFDGRGHVISDFTMKGKEGLGGLFAYVVTGEIKNVHVKDAVYNIDTTETSNYIVGGIVAYNMGSDIYGCSFTGDITVNLNTNVNSFIGGIVGFGQGYSDTNSATISYSTANVNFISDGISPLLAVGGIAGSVYGTSNSAPMLIYNSVFNGNIGGKVILAGGIVGYLRENTSIANCFTSGNFAASNAGGRAAAGAFVGLAEHETALTNSYSTATCSTVGSAMEDTTKNDLAGNMYLDGDQINGGSESIDSREMLILNSYLVHNGQVVSRGKYDLLPTVNFADFTEVKKLLKWNDTEWTIENNVPQAVVKADEDYKLNFTITFDFDGKTLPGGAVGFESSNADMYIPLDWAYQGNGQNTFKATDKSISYGYFLDSAHTIRLPSAMLLSSDITVYVGFEDYSSIAAEYFVTDAYGSEAIITFDDNGMMTMNYDGRIARYVYVYDGEKILIKDAYFAYMYFTSSSGSSLISDFYATAENDVLTIYDNTYFIKDSSRGVLKAYKGNAVKGDWYDAEQSTFTFYLDGTGVKVTASTREIYFTYTIDQHNISITMEGVTYNAALSADGRTITTSQGAMLSLDKFDLFAGDWETSFNNQLKVSFDGMGSMIFGGAQATYTVDENGVINFTQGQAVINEDGLIEIVYNGGEYTLARANSYRGVWVDTAYDYTIVFEGVGVNGYGHGYDSEGFDFTYVSEPSDSSSGLTLSLYYRTSFYGYGDLAVDSKGNEYLSFAVYYSSISAIYDNFVLTYYDPFEGEWDNADGITFNFNGLGAYDISTFVDNMQWTVQGEVTITDGKDEQTVRYTYDRTTAAAKFTYKSKSYVVTIDKLGNAQFSVAGGDDSPLYGADMYQDIVLGGGGYIISFNGKSLSGNGVATVIKGDDKQTYKYTLDGSTISLLSESAVAFTITLDEQLGYMVMSGGSAEVLLGRYTPMGGNTYIATGNNSITVGEFDFNGSAQGVVLGEQATLVYQTQNQIAVYINGELTYYLVYQNENNAVLYNAGGLTLISMFVIPDGIGGTYVGTDGSSFEFDGRSLVFGYYANVIFTADNDETYYYYRLNDDGSFTVFALDRSGENDVHVDKYAVYTTEHQGAVKYTSESGAELWIAAAE